MRARSRLQAIKLFDPPLQLALKATPSIGHVYNWLERFEQRREVLNLVIERLYVREEGITAVTLKPSFRLTTEKRVREVQAPPPGHNPHPLHDYNSLISYQILYQAVS